MNADFASVFYEIALLVLLAAGVGFVGLMLRQPLVVAFIAVGVLAGPDALGLVSSVDFIETLSQISIAVLLGRVSEVVEIVWRRNLRVNQHPPNRRRQPPGRSRHEAEYR